MSIWTSWLTELAGEHPLDALFYLGCDEPELLRGLPEQTSAPLVLANCNPALQDEAAEMAARSGQVHLWPKAIAAKPGKRAFHVLSLPGLSGLAAPQDLYGLFPNLRLLETCEVPAAPLSALLAEAPRKGHGPRVLRAELAGAEPDLLEQILALPEEESLEHLLLRIPADGLYEGKLAGTEFLARLTSQDYAVQARSDADPDFPEYWLRLEPAKRETRRLQQLMSDTWQTLQRDLDQARARIEELSRALIVQEDRTRREAAGAEALQAALEAQAQQGQAQLAQKDARIAVLSRSLTEQEARARLESEALRAMLETSSRIAEEDTAASRAETDALRAQVQQLGARLQEVEATGGRAGGAAAEELARTQRELDVAQRMQTLLQGDLQDLRTRHQALQADREAQDGLLRELADRLGPLLARSTTAAGTGTGTGPGRGKPARGQGKARKDG